MTPRRTLALVGLLAMVLALLAPSADARSSNEQSTTDARIGVKDCTLLGRSYVDSYGCSRRTCLNSNDFMKTDPNAETCLVGGRKGRPYGQPIDQRRCVALHRTWVGVVNYCVSNPHRGVKLIRDAPQCKAPYTVYLTLTEQEGYYDLCLTPDRVSMLRSMARKGNTTLSEQAAAMSQPLCTYRPRSQFSDGRCHQVKGPLPRSARGGVLLVGDSVSWRGTNELARKRPDWFLDGIPYRHVNKLPARVARFGVGHGRPTGLIVALGTNPSPKWTRADYARALNMKTPKGILMFVTPYRASGTNTSGTVKAVTRYAGYMKHIARKNRHVCVADWRQLVQKRPGLLVDGVHQTSYGEGVWATFISRAWKTCVKAVAKQDAAANPGGGSDPDPGNPGGGGIIPPISIPPIIPIIIGGLGLGG